jgi:hypothetical protein
MNSTTATVKVKTSSDLHERIWKEQKWWVNVKYFNNIIIKNIIFDSGLSRLVCSFFGDANMSRCGLVC